MPISAASWPAKSGVSTTCEINGTKPNVAPIAKPAVSSGMPAAMSEPNITSSTKNAAKKPMNSVAPCSCSP